LSDPVVASSHVAMRKPERAIYELTCARLEIQPNEAIFVDDNADNIAAAREFGMGVVHFDGDPWSAGRARQTARSVATTHAPLTVISPISTVMPAIDPGRNVGRVGHVTEDTLSS